MEEPADGVRELHDETEQTVDELLTALEEASERGGAEGGPKLNALPVIWALLADQASAGEVLGSTFARDQGEFFGLILELTDFAATCITIRAARYGTPATDTLADLEEMLKEFVDARPRPASLPARRQGGHRPRGCGTVGPGPSPPPVVTGPT